MILYGSIDKWMVSSISTYGHVYIFVFRDEARQPTNVMSLLRDLKYVASTLLVLDASCQITCP